MAIGVLQAATPTVLNAVYDRVWIQEIVISAPSPDGDAQARACLRKFRVTDAGSEFAPDAAEWLTVENVLAESAKDPDLAAAIAPLMGFIAKRAAAQGMVAHEGGFK